MTAPVTGRAFAPQEWPVSGDRITGGARIFNLPATGRATPGSFWERVAEGKSA